jgi:uncharacterized protein (TIGR00255 family)
MIRSMTAFARAEATAGPFTASVEIRSYNSRHLDLALRLPHGFHDLEERVRKRIAGTVVRGRIETRFQIQETTESAAAFEIDTHRAEAYHRVLGELRQRFDLDGPMGADLFVSAGLIKPAEVKQDPEACWEAVDACLTMALADLTAMREKEGAHLAGDLNRRLAAVTSALGEIATAVADLAAAYRDRLTDRIQALTDGLTQIDPARIAQEAAILADRSDISEEVVRAESHLKQFFDIMAGEAPAGRKLNFLLQEMNREFNTMGSKCANAGAAHLIVDVKAELEKIREQVQNVE